MGDLGSIPGLGRSPGEGKGYSLQYSSLENSMDRGAWWYTVHGVTKSWTRLSNSHTRTHTQDLVPPGIKPGSPALQAGSLPVELSGKPKGNLVVLKVFKISLTLCKNYIGKVRLHITQHYESGCPPFSH